jgi:hypothetical protein
VSKHSPGPWKWKVNVPQIDGCTLWDLEAPGDLIVEDLSIDPSTPNMRLIAAAPDLLELVKRFRQWDDLPGRGDGPMWMKWADEVIEQATGEKP